MTKIAGSGSISQRQGSADPDPQQNVLDPQHCFKVMLMYFSNSTRTLQVALPQEEAHVDEDEDSPGGDEVPPGGGAD